MQTKSLGFIDTTRALAAFFMVFTHVVGLYSTNAIAEHSFFGKAIGLLGEAPAAPVFMVAMGILFSYKGKADFHLNIKRGIKLLFKGYALNIARIILPGLVFLLFLIFESSHSGGQDNLGSEMSKKALDSIFVIDILHLAGLSYIVLSVFQKLGLKNYSIVFVMTAVAFISPVIWGMGTSLPFIGRGFDLLWGTGGEQVSFPLFPWLVYPLLGMILGNIYRDPLKLTPRTMLYQAGLGGVLAAIGLVMALGNWEYHFGDYWRTGPGGLFVYTGFVLIWLSLFFLLNDFIPSFFAEFFRFVSRNITNFYITQWLIISIGIVFVEEDKLGMLPTIFAISVVCAMTVLICRFLQKKNINF